MEVINRLLGLLLGLALLAGGLIVVVETVFALADRPGWLIDRDELGQVAAQLQWDDRDLIVAASVVAVIGLALLLLQLWPARPRFLAMNPHAQNRRVTISRRGLQELLRRAAVEDQDVLGADTAVRRRKAPVKVRTPADTDAKTVRARVDETVRARIDALGLKRRMSPRVRVERSKERVR